VLLLLTGVKFHSHSEVITCIVCGYTLCRTSGVFVVVPYKARRFSASFDSSFVQIEPADLGDWEDEILGRLLALADPDPDT